MGKKRPNKPASRPGQQPPAAKEQLQTQPASQPASQPPSEPQSEPKPESPAGGPAERINLEEFSSMADKLKADIYSAISRQADQLAEPSGQAVSLERDIRELCAGPRPGCEEAAQPAPQPAPQAAPQFRPAQPEREGQPRASPEPVALGERLRLDEQRPGRQSPEAPPPAAPDSPNPAFEPLNAQLDAETKVAALRSRCLAHFGAPGGCVEPLCRKLVALSERGRQLELEGRRQGQELAKALALKARLEALCRELQKSNNSIRVESLSLVQLEQRKARDQTTKIQSTLGGVMKLFDENQQRNQALRQENQELQTKLKSLLEHCERWEKGVDTALRQRDLEVRLLKAELAQANLARSEQKERFLDEKQDLLGLLAAMQEQQRKIEAQEARLRADLASYASKYDECQQVLSKGMDKFQLESRRMLAQLDRSKQDYKSLLAKYEANSRRMMQLLKEKQAWERGQAQAARKVEALERLCRALADRAPGAGNTRKPPTPSISDGGGGGGDDGHGDGAGASNGEHCCNRQSAGNNGHADPALDSSQSSAAIEAPAQPLV